MVNPRILLSVLFAIIAFAARANMASPIRRGTEAASPFISQHVDVVREKILIIPDKDFNTARFRIEYHIKANKPGKQIPLLFYASEYKSDFRVWVDDKEVQLSNVPEPYKSLEGTPFSDFGYLFEKDNSNSLVTGSQNQPKQVLIPTDSQETRYVSIANLKFFETDLSEGEHTIRIEYVADKWTDKSKWEWINEYSFRYALAPAKYWKSFKDLEITLEAPNLDGTLTTNLGNPTSGDLQSKAVWKFNRLPVDVLKISYKPQINSLGSILIAISPGGLALILLIILIFLHVRAIRSYRRRNPNRKYSPVMIIGSIVVPFLFLLGYVLSYNLIDSVIGPDASQRHGYYGFALIIYPALLAIYWIAMWLVDRTIARRIMRSANQEK